MLETFLFTIILVVPYIWIAYEFKNLIREFKKDKEYFFPIIKHTYKKFKKIPYWILFATYFLQALILIFVLIYWTCTVGFPIFLLLMK